MLERPHKNQRGSAYILIIIIFAIISTLGITVVSVSMMTYKMKRIEFQSKAAFYLSEAGLEEIYGLIAKEVDNAISYGILEREIKGGGQEQFKTSYTTYINEKLYPCIGSYSCTVLDPEFSNATPILKILEVALFTKEQDTFSITIQSSYRYNNVTHTGKAIYEISIPTTTTYPLNEGDIDKIIHMRYLSEHQAGV